MSEKLERPEEHEAPSATASDLSRGPASPHSDPPIPIGEAARLADLYATLCKARIGRELREAGRQLGEHTTTQNLSRVLVLRGELDTPPPGLDDQD